MNVKRGMSEVKKLKREGYSPIMIALMVGETLKKFESGKRLTIPERLILGLRYSEFLADDDTPLAYEQAELKRQEYLKVLGVSPKDINELCRKHCNLR